MSGAVLAQAFALLLDPYVLWVILGSAVFGLFVARTGYPAAFVLTGLLMVVALRPAWRERSAHVRGPR